MPNRIVVLSEDTANKIAAGEVVERPASIVKELVENAIDAGASDIRVEIEKGGMAAIAVIDNGSGIEGDDVALAFERHATSKIRNFEDIYSVASLGFRGEALPSIASVSRMELLTRRPGDVAGTRAVAESGTIKEVAPAGCPAGTSIRVTKILENVPARRKFLKTETTEQSLCLDVIVRLALVHPEIRFRVFAGGREIFSAPEVKSIEERIALVLGSDFSDHCLPVAAGEKNISLSGFVSKPEFTRSNSKNIFLFVNKRFIRDTGLIHALLSAYRQIIEAKRYPAAVLFLEMPPGDVDVNVHPAKMEVRFKDSRGVHDLISHAVSGALASGETAKSNFVYRLAPREEKTFPSVFRRNQDSSPGITGLYSRKNLEQAISRDLLTRSRVEEPPPAADGIHAGGQRIVFDDYEYVGQFAGTYLIFAGNNGLMLIDQHAAHERIMFEKLKKSSGGKTASQALLLPEVVSLTAGEMALFSECTGFLKQLGIDVEIFGRDAVVVKALPAVLPQTKCREIISDIVDELGNQNKVSDTKERQEKILASLACRAAVKANHVLSPEEIRALCNDLAETPNNSTCPHGRPVSIGFSTAEIERMFKRK